MLVVEGPDGAGKTTLITKLQAELGWEVSARVVSQQAEPMVDLQAWVDENLSKGFHHAIFDRHRLISEPIYGPIIRGTNAPGFDEIEWLAPRLFTFFRHVRPIIIYCLPPFKVVKRNVESDLHNRTIAPHIEAIYGAYCERVSRSLAYRMSGSAVNIWYDYTAQSHTFGEVMRKIYVGMSEGSTA